MSNLFEFLPGGDLVVVFGQGDAKKTVKVHKPFLRNPSPVFAALLGPQFQEGHEDYSVANPLAFPEDDPDAMLNLCHVLRWKTDTMDTTSIDWLQKLAVVCDKYRCADRVREFFQAMITDNDLSYMDRSLIYCLIGKQDQFVSWSSWLIRNPKAEVESSRHPGLLQLLPKGILDNLADSPT